MAIKRIRTEYCDITLRDMSKEVRVEVRKAVRRGLSEAGKEYKKSVKAFVKSNLYRKGTLYKSIGYKVDSTSSGEPRIKIGAGKNGGRGGGGYGYAHLPEYGTGKRFNKKQNHSTGTMPETPYLRPLKDKQHIAREKVEQQLKGIGGW